MTDYNLEQNGRTGYGSGKDDMVLAMAYVKRQKWDDVFNCDTGLSKGTIFPALEKPFLGQGGRSR